METELHSLNPIARVWAAFSLATLLTTTAPPARADVTEAWVHRYSNVVTNANDQAVKVVRDAAGDIIVTGTTERDMLTIKYSGADGSAIWQQRYNGPDDSRDFPQALAVDGSGNVVVTGYSGDYPDPNAWSMIADYYTAKYAAATGALLWERRYNGPANSDDRAQAVAVDGSGNVVVTGYSQNGARYDSDYYTAKYAAADGALLWEKRYNGPMYAWNKALALALDGSGNVLVTGESGTIKYLANGTEVWTNIAGGTALAVDESGNVVVTRDSSNGTNTDYSTAKYAAADGALLWEKRYNGPANGRDFVAGQHSLALGPNGMVAVTGTSSGDYATVVYWENLPPVAIERVPTGVRLRFTGVPERSQTIQRAPAVTGPWTTLNTQIAPASGLLDYFDAPAPSGQAFYRTVQP